MFSYIRNAFAALLLITACNSYSFENLTDDQACWIANKIYYNECRQKFQCLIAWNEGESFPSLGIGHFIWYPTFAQSTIPPFQESFPMLIQFMREKNIVLPKWLNTLDPFAAPWSSREDFLKQEQTTEVVELKQFLFATQTTQTQFLILRTQHALEQIIASSPAEIRSPLKRFINELTQNTQGIYAVVDYVNFKGEGLNPNERYNHQGWGLMQVLEAAIAVETAKGRADKISSIERFSLAATQILELRAKNAPNPIERTRWLDVWKKRINTYTKDVDQQNTINIKHCQ